MDEGLAADSGQRAADVVAVMVMTHFHVNGADADLLRLGSIVAAYCAKQSPEELKKYSEMDWPQAVLEIKIAFAKHYLASNGAGPDELPPPAVDEHIGKCLIAAFFKFMTLRSVDPGWYAPHLQEMRLAAKKMPNA